MIAYKEYLIIYNAVNGLYNVSKGGFHITTQTTLNAAKAAIDLVAE